MTKIVEVCGRDANDKKYVLPQQNMIVTARVGVYSTIIVLVSV